MATVPKSSHVYASIRENINRLFEPRIKEASENLSGMSRAELGEKIYKEVMPPETIAYIEQRWNHPALLIYSGSEDSNPSLQQRTAKEITLRINKSYESFPLSSDRYISDALCRYGNGYVIPLERIDTPTAKEIIALFVERDRQVKLATDARDEFLIEFDKAWNAVASVNQLIAVWPAARQLLDKVEMPRSGRTVLAQIDQKTERRSTKVVAQEINTTALNTHMLMARVAA